MLKGVLSQPNFSPQTNTTQKTQTFPPFPHKFKLTSTIGSIFPALSCGRLVIIIELHLPLLMNPSIFLFFYDIRVIAILTPTKASNLNNKERNRRNSNSNCRLVCSVGRAPDYFAGGRETQGLKITEENVLML